MNGTHSSRFSPPWQRPPGGGLEVVATLNPSSASRPDGRRAVILSTEQPGENALFLQARGKPVERGDRTLLSGVRFQLSRVEELGVSPPDRPDHAGALRSRMRFSVPVKL